MSLQQIDITNLKGKSKVSRLKIRPDVNQARLAKPKWIRIKYGYSSKVIKLKQTLRKQSLFTVCEEAQCPNLNECFSNGSATFMIMGRICTRRCPFCDVAHGKPLPLDVNEPRNLAKTITEMKLNYVVITSVDRDDLKDGGARHFKDCIYAIYNQNPNIKIEILAPDFRGRLDKALTILKSVKLDVFNHNLETVPRLYPQARPGADYKHSLLLLRKFKQMHPQIITKSGLMLGLGETRDEVLTVMMDLRAHNVNMLTLGQYLQPSKYHLAVKRYIKLEEFNQYRQLGLNMGFANVASAPLVRSSYHADLQHLKN